MFDEQPVLAATVDHLNRNRLEAFFGRSPAIPWLDLLRNTRVVARDDSNVDRPTVAGLLTFGTEPSEFIPSGAIEAARYGGERLSSDELVHAERLAGPVSDQIDGAVAFVAQFMRPALATRSTRGADAPYDLDVVDEAIVNAVAHRGYELYSPGGLPNTITLDEMPYRTFTRNQLLVSSCPESAASAPGRCSSSHEAKACARSSRMARPIRAAGRSTRSSVTSFG